MRIRVPEATGPLQRRGGHVNAGRAAMRSMESGLFTMPHVDAKVTGATLEKTWLNCWRCSVFALTSTTPRNMSPGYRKKLVRLRDCWMWEDRELHFFIAFVVVGFGDMMKYQRLNWMKNRPTQPYPGWVLGTRDSLFDIWHGTGLPGTLGDVELTSFIADRIYRGEFDPRKNPGLDPSF